jgi:hypothetical protein
MATVKMAWRPVSSTRRSTARRRWSANVGAKSSNWFDACLLLLRDLLRVGLVGFYDEDRCIVSPRDLVLPERNELP